MAISTEVPEWLKPPSESERRRLKVVEEQVAARATSMLRKNVGFARMKDQAAKLVQSGTMSELDARKKALLDNADLIFSDEPAALANLLQSEQAQRIEEKNAEVEKKWREGQITDLQLRRNLPQSTLGKLMADRDAAMDLGDSDKVAAYDTEIAGRNSNKGLEVTTTNPDGTTTTVRQGRLGSSDLTVANKTKLQEAISSEIQTLDAAEKLEPLLTGETVGMLAFLESVAKDRILSQFMPGVASQNRADAETIASDLRAARIRALKSDSQIGVKEVEKIEKVVPEVNAPFKSAEGQRNLVRALKKVAVVRAAYKSKLLGEKVPGIVSKSLSEFDEGRIMEMVDNGLVTLSQLEDSKIIEMAKSGKITREQAIEAYNLKRK